MLPRLSSAVMRAPMRGFSSPLVCNARGMATSSSKPPSPATKPSSGDTNAKAAGAGSAAKSVGASASAKSSPAERHSIFDIDAPRYRKVPASLGTGAGAYASSIFSKTKSIDEVVRTAKDLEKFLGVLAKDKTLASNVLDSDAKPEMLQSFLSKYFKNVKVAAPTRDLFIELARKSKFAHISAITKNLYSLINAGLGLVNVKVVMADKNAKAPTQDEIVKKLELPKGSTVKVTLQHDANLLGGYVLQTEDKLLDNSYRKDVQELDAKITQHYRNRLDKELAQLDARVAL